MVEKFRPLPEAGLPRIAVQVYCPLPPLAVKLTAWLTVIEPELVSWQLTGTITVLFTVAVTAAETVLLPFESKACAVIVCKPLADPVVSHKIE